MLVAGGFPEVVGVHLQQSPLDGAPHDPGAEGPGEDARKKRNHVEDHGTTSSSGRSTTMRPAARSIDRTTSETAGTST